MAAPAMLGATTGPADVMKAYCQKAGSPRVALACSAIRKNLPKRLLLLHPGRRSRFAREPFSISSPTFAPEGGSRIPCGRLRPQTPRTIPRELKPMAFLGGRLQYEDAAVLKLLRGDVPTIPLAICRPSLREIDFLKQTVCRLVLPHLEHPADTNIESESISAVGLLCPLLPVPPPFFLAPPRDLAAGLPSPCNPWPS